MELFFVPCPPLTVTISLFDPELSLRTLDKLEEGEAWFPLPSKDGFNILEPLFCSVLFKAEVIADTDDKGATFVMATV